LSKEGLMFYVKTRGLRVLVIGAGKVARRKIFKLKSAGASITVVAKERPKYPLEGIKVELADGLEYARRHMEGFDMVVAATDDGKLNDAIADLALGRRKLVSVASCSSRGNVFFPAIIQVNDVQIGVSTEGKSPLVAKFVKRRIMKALGKEDLAWIDFAIRARRLLQSNGFKPFAAREFLKDLDRKRASAMSDEEILSEARAWERGEGNQKGGA